MATDGYYPPAIDNPAYSAGGTHLGPVTVGCLHTTESTRFVPSTRNYFGHQSYPHFTVAVVTINGERTFRVWQHISIRRSARALKNQSGGGQTNNEGVIQIEVVGTALDPFTDDPVMVEGLSKLMRWIESETDITPTSDVFWNSYPASYGERAKQRLSLSAWRSYVGWLGHQHVIENDHGDPGKIQIEKLLLPASETPSPAVKPENTSRKEIDMILVDDPNVGKPTDSPKQYLCDANTKRWVKSENELKGLVLAGVPQLTEKPETRTYRQGILDARREVTAP